MSIYSVCVCVWVPATEERPLKGLSSLRTSPLYLVCQFSYEYLFNLTMLSAAQTLQSNDEMTKG
jgi:hypothetical protein